MSLYHIKFNKFILSFIECEGDLDKIFQKSITLFSNLPEFLDSYVDPLVYQQCTAYLIAISGKTEVDLGNGFAPIPAVVAVSQSINPYQEIATKYNSAYCQKNPLNEDLKYVYRVLNKWPNLARNSTISQVSRQHHDLAHITSELLLGIIGILPKETDKNDITELVSEHPKLSSQWKESDEKERTSLFESMMAEAAIHSQSKLHLICDSNGNIKAASLINFPNETYIDYLVSAPDAEKGAGTAILVLS